jgi:hypothetical protein
MANAVPEGYPSVRPYLHRAHPDRVSTLSRSGTKPGIQPGGPLYPSAKRLL